MSNRRIPPTYLRLRAVMQEALEDTAEEPRDAEVSKKTASLLCDIIQSTLHRDEELRDAIVDTRYNDTNDSLLLILNASLNKRRLLRLASVLQSIPEIEAMSYSSRKDNNGSEIQLVKVKGHAEDVNRAEMDRQNY